MFDDVLAFHEKFNSDIGEYPNIPTLDVQKLRIKLIKEETKELKDALQKKDVPEVADALADLLYVTFGTAIACGIDIRPVWDEVQKANMAKEGGGKRDDGKIMKLAGWQTSP